MFKINSKKQRRQRLFRFFILNFDHIFVVKFS